MVFQSFPHIPGIRLPVIFILGGEFVGCRDFLKEQHIYYRIKYGKDKAALAGNQGSK